MKTRKQPRCPSPDFRCLDTSCMFCHPLQSAFTKLYQTMRPLHTQSHFALLATGFWLGITLMETLLHAIQHVPPRLQGPMADALFDDIDPLREHIRRWTSPENPMPQQWKM